MRSPAEAAPSHLWVPELADPGGVVELSREESHYLVRVCRARVGDLASATDGRGALDRLRARALAGLRVHARALAATRGRGPAPVAPAPSHGRARADRTGEAGVLA